MNTVYFKASEGHYLWGFPKKDAGIKAYGPRFYRINYPNKEDKLNYEKMKNKGMTVIVTLPKHKQPVRKGV